MKSSDNIRCIRKYEKKDGSITYHAEVRRKNAKPLRESFRTLTDAKNWVRKQESAILDGKYIPDNKARKYTLSDLIDQYIRLHLSKFPRRLKDQASHLKWWQAQYGHKPLIEISPSLLAEAKELLLNGLTPSKTNRTNSTVNRYFSSLSRAFTIAFQEWQWISENPFRRVSKLKENAGRNRFLSKEELNMLLERCKESKNSHLYGMVLIAASMGLRFGEIAGLRWKHIDFDNGFATLEQTKNGDVRFVPLPDQVAAYLKDLQHPKLADEFLFPSKNSKNRHPPSMIRKAFQKALQLAGIEKFKYHDLRHTCASHLAMNGATQGELMEILGHRSPAMTKKYAHFSKEHIARVLQKTSNNLIGPPGETA
ncbi:MAG: site-specific integrase [Verrucomicrobia bacterium]|nr:site-specific integrase [Verrucomicrobiota bacterium]